MAVQTYEEYNTLDALEISGFSTLNSLIKKSGLDVVLKDAESLTIFAPTNSAFDNLEEDFLNELKKPENKEDLKKFLMYHIIPEKMPIETVKRADTIESMNGRLLNIYLTSMGDYLVNDANIKDFDIYTKNGIIHVLDQVLFEEKQEEG